MLRRPQRANDIFDFILLKQAYAGDASRSYIQARCCILHRDAAESKYRNLSLACLSQRSDSCGHGLASAAFSEHWREDSEVDSFGLRASHVLM